MTDRPQTTVEVMFEKMGIIFYCNRFRIFILYIVNIDLQYLRSPEGNYIF